MRSDDLNREQALKAKLTPLLRYLGRLQQRMIWCGVTPVDPLLSDVCRAYDVARLKSRMVKRGFPPVDPLLCDVCRARIELRPSEQKPDIPEPRPRY